MMQKINTSYSTTDSDHNSQKTTAEDIAFDSEYIAWSISVFSAVLVFIGLSLGLDHLWQPDNVNVLDLADRLSVMPVSAFCPESKEKALFFLGLMALPLLFIIFYLPARRVVMKSSIPLLKRLSPVVIASTLLLIAGLAAAGMMADNPFHIPPLNGHDTIAKTNLQFYFITTFLYEHPLLYALVFYPLIAALLWNSKYLLQRIPQWGEPLTRFSCYGWCTSLIILILIINTFSFPQNLANAYDFSAVYYSMVQVFSGTPLLVDNFSNTYGLYPHFLVPIFKVIGLDIANFSFVMALLTSFSFLLLLIFLRRHIRSTAILMLCFTSFAFYSHFYSKIVAPFDAYFAGQPIRFLFPMISLLLSSLYTERRTTRFRTFSLLILATGILWNPEFGAFTYGAFVLFLLTMEFISNNKSVLAGNIVRHIASALICLVVVLLSYALTIRVYYGAFPELLRMFSTLKMFSKIGFNMLPMPLLHPWNLVALVFLIGIGAFLVAAVNRSLTPRHAIILLVTLHGIGAFMYYQGRSHNWNLLGATAYAFILIAFFVESLTLISHKVRHSFFPWALLVFALGSSVFQFPYAYRKIYTLINNSEEKINNQHIQNMIFENARFIRDYSVKNEKILVLTEDYIQTYYYALSHTRAAFNPGLIEFFWRSDLNRLVVFLSSNRDIKVFLEPHRFSINYPAINNIIKNLYEPYASNGNLTLLLPR